MSHPLVFEVEVDGRGVSVAVDTPKIEVSPDDRTVVFAVSPGPRGRQGLPGTGAPIVGESLSGADGVTTVFATANEYRGGTTAVYVNGLREDYYTESGPGEITFEDAPLASDTLRIDYII